MGNFILHDYQNGKSSDFGAEKKLYHRLAIEYSKTINNQRNITALINFSFKTEKMAAFRFFWLKKLLHFFFHNNVCN